MVRRLLIGLNAIGNNRVLMMPDAYGLCQQALSGLGASQRSPDVRMLDMPITHNAADSRRAAEMMRDAGAGCVIVLGGDGTARIVSQGLGNTAMLALSTGTNNVLPCHADGTIAGIAAGAIARQLVPIEQCAIRHKRLSIVTDTGENSALVDVTILDQQFIGSRAIWDARSIRQIIVTRANPSSVGITSIASMIQPIGPSEPVGLSVTVGEPSERDVAALLAPGLIVNVPIESHQRLAIGDKIDITASNKRLLLALDGEREIAIDKGKSASVTLRRDGPWVIDIERTMHELAHGGQLYNLRVREEET